MALLKYTLAATFPPKFTPNKIATKSTSKTALIVLNFTQYICIKSSLKFYYMATDIVVAKNLEKFVSLSKNVKNNMPCLA